MSKIFVGGDISKGYADFCFLNESGSELQQSARYDDTAAGHGKLVSALRQLGKERSVSVLVGVESTGGYEENWLGGLLKLAESGLDVTAYRFNPAVIKRYCDLKLHRSVNDAQAARDIARFLSQAKNRELGRPMKAGLRSEKRYYRSIVKQIKRLAEIKVDLLLAVSTNHPELVRYLSTQTPGWILRLLAKWPTARRLANAKPETVAQIKGITMERAIELVSQANSSVGCSMAKSDELTLQMLAGEVRELKVKIKRWKTQLEEIMAGDPAVLILQSIPGIALWSAIAIRLEIGDFADFPRAAGLVAYSGLDPTPKSSGDGHSTGVISKRGSSNLRAVLFMCAFVACTGKIQDPSKKTAGEDSGNEEEALKNRVFRSFYQRLRARG
jgi:transposase